MGVVVVGAGVVGLSCAFELADRGHEVTVLDAGAVGAAASAGNAGWVTPLLCTPRAAPGAVRDAVRSFTSTQGPARMRPHPELDFATWVTGFLRASSRKRSSATTASLQSLGAHAIRHVDALGDRGVRFEHHEDGLAVVFKKAVNADSFSQTVTRMRSLGYTGDVTTHRGSDIADFDPAIRRDVAAVVHLEDERHVRPESLTAGLSSALEERGGKIFEGDPVVTIDRAGVSGWTVRTGAGREHRADHVVVSAGFASRDLLRPLGVRVPLEAAKGTSLTAEGEGTAPSHPMKLYEHMVACSPFDDGVRLSGTFDLGQRGNDLQRKRLDMVVRHGLEYLESWRPTRTKLEWVGHRPTTIDDTPLIGPVKGHEGLYLATGHGTLGVTLGPVTGVLVADEITSGQEQSLLSPFRPSRFRPALSRR